MEKTIKLKTSITAIGATHKEVIKQSKAQLLGCI